MRKKMDKSEVLKWESLMGATGTWGANEWKEIWNRSSNWEKRDGQQERKDTKDAAAAELSKWELALLMGKVPARVLGSRSWTVDGKKSRLGLRPVRMN